VLGIRLGEAQERNFQLEEKVKYLTDLVNELNSELEARSKLIRQLSTQIKVSGRTTADMDKYKLERAQRQNSLMGSLFSPTKKDSLVEEVNAKMSSVLEDTLIKNMQLQEDLKVMGAEVDRLLRENEALKRQLQEYTKINTNTNNSTQNTV
jgi:cell division septum initiation protein DivIVA